MGTPGISKSDSWRMEATVRRGSSEDGVLSETGGSLLRQLFEKTFSIYIQSKRKVSQGMPPNVHAQTPMMALASWLLASTHRWENCDHPVNGTKTV